MSAQLAAVNTPVKIGRYRVHEIIGRGGSSVVYRAGNDHARALPPVVAVKVAHDERCADADFRRQFREESRVSAAIDHPSVLPVVDSGDDRGRPYLVMPHIEGSDLGRQLTGQALTVGRVLVLLRQVADGLDAMHRSGVLHLDVKPSNVLVGRPVRRIEPAPGQRVEPAPGQRVEYPPGQRAEPPPGQQAEFAPGQRFAYPPGQQAGGDDRAGRAFLTDLGLCRFLDEPRRFGAERGGEDFVGSPRYASPEHLRGRVVRPSSDVYSLACVLFACLAGHPPYVGDVPAVVTGHLSGRVPSLSALTGLPRCLDGVVRRGMHPDPGSRYGSCAELVTRARLSIVDGRP